MSCAETGAQSGCLLAGSQYGQPLDEAAALMAARGFAGLAGMDLAKVVSQWTRPTPGHEGSLASGPGKVACPDMACSGRAQALSCGGLSTFGVKRNILRMLADRGCELTVVPAQTLGRRGQG